MQKNVGTIGKLKLKAKERLLLCGELLFTSPQITHITSRMIADEAKVNHALIAYYYGTVANLMEEVVNRCLEKLKANILPEINAFEQSLRAVEDDQLRGVVFASCINILKHLQSKESARLLQALASPTSRYVVNVYPCFVQAVIEPLFKCFVVATVRAKSLDENSFETAALAQVMVAQMMAFYRGASVVCQHIHCEQLNDTQQSNAGEIIANSINAVLFN